MIVNRGPIVQEDGAAQRFAGALFMEKWRPNGDDLKVRYVSDADKSAGRHGGAEVTSQRRASQRDVGERFRLTTVRILIGRFTLLRRFGIQHDLPLVTRRRRQDQIFVHDC